MDNLISALADDPRAMPSLALLVYYAYTKLLPMSRARTVFLEIPVWIALFQLVDFDALKIATFLANLPSAKSHSVVRFALGALFERTIVRLFEQRFCSKLFE